jgi:MFS family permease
LIGYGLAALSKPLFPLANGIDLVMTARFVDRVGKGIRGAPRDALIVDVTPSELSGTAFGLRQSMDTVGAFLGPLLAILLMRVTGDHFRFVFWIAAIPSAIAVCLIVYGVREPVSLRSSEPRRFPIRSRKLARLSGDFRWLIVIAAMLAMARFSEAFLLLAAQHAGMTISFLPGILVMMNIVYAATSLPFGRLADRMSRRMLLVIGVSVLIAADVVLATAGTAWQVVVGAAIWGLHMGATQGLLSALVADAVPGDLRATAFGFYGLVMGGALLAASVVAGWLWTSLGPGATFTAGAVFAGLALIIITAQQPKG